MGGRIQVCRLIHAVIGRAMGTQHSTMRSVFPGFMFRRLLIARADVWLARVSIGWLVGCSAGAPYSAACGGPPPTFDACDVGAAWADCHGVGTTSTFACADSSACNGCGHECRWFVDGCVPREFVASACPSGALCCETGGRDAGAGRSGGSPFASGSDRVADEVPAFTAAWGEMPWNRDREALVEVVLGRPGHGLQPALCFPGAGPLRLCECGLGESDRELRGNVLVVQFRDETVAPAPYPDRLVVELDGHDGPNAARACIVNPTVTAPSALCQSTLPAVCATSGTINMAAYPATEQDAASMRMDADLMFVDGTRITFGL